MKLLAIIVAACIVIVGGLFIQTIFHDDKRR